MASLFRLEIHNSGFAEVRKSLQGEIDALAESVAAAAGGAPDFIAISSPGRDRARAVVVTATPKGMREEAENRSLSRAFGAGR